MPSQPVQGGAARCPTAPATRAASRSPAASRTPRGWRRPTCATPRSTSRSIPTAGTTAGGAGRRRSRRWPRARRSSSARSSAPRPPAPSAGGGAAGLTVLSFSNNPVGRRRQRLHPRHHLREHRRPAGRLRPSRTACATSASSIRPGSRARPRATRSIAAVSRRGATLAAAQPYNLSVEGIQAAAGPIAAALIGAGANAVILTDGPTGGLAFISEALRGNGVTADQAQFMGMQRWDVSAEALGGAEPAGRGLRRARPRRSIGAFDGRYQHRLRRGAARARRARLRRHRRGRRADRPGARPGRQPVLHRAPDPARRLRRRQRRRSASARTAGSSATSRSSRCAAARRWSPSGQRGRLTPLASDQRRVARRRRRPGAAWPRRRRPSSTSPATRAAIDAAAARGARPRRDPHGGGRACCASAYAEGRAAIAAEIAAAPARGAPRDPRLLPGWSTSIVTLTLDLARALAASARRTRPPPSGSAPSPSAATAAPRWRPSPTSTSCSSPPTSRRPGARA